MPVFFLHWNRRPPFCQKMNPSEKSSKMIMPANIFIPRPKNSYSSEKIKKSCKKLVKFAEIG